MALRRFIGLVSRSPKFTFLVVCASSIMAALSSAAATFAEDHILIKVKPDARPTIATNSAEAFLSGLASGLGLPPGARLEEPPVSRLLREEKNAYNSQLLTKTRVDQTFSIPGGGIALSWLSPPNAADRQPFRVATASSLNAPWQLITSTAGFGYTATRTYWTNSSPNAAASFYRVQIWQP
jgi:hypothetical protein